jgi:hypothetical protein
MLVTLWLLVGVVAALDKAHLRVVAVVLVVCCLEQQHLTRLFLIL